MKVIQKRFMGTIVLAGILTIAGCSSSSNSQNESDSGGTNSESSIDNGINTAPSEYQILKVLEPLLSSIVKFTDTEYVAEGQDPNYKAIFPIMKSNFVAVMEAEANWRQLTSQIDYQETNISGLESSINAYNTGLEQWITHQQAGLTRWQTCLDTNDDNFQMTLCTVEGLDLEKEQSILNSYTAPLRNLLEKLGLTP